MDSTVIGLCLFNEWQLIHISTSKSSIERFFLDLVVHLENGSLKEQNRTRSSGKEKTYPFSVWMSRNCKCQQQFFVSKKYLHQSNKSANIEWNLLQTVDDMVLKLANFLCKLQLVWDPFWIVLSLHYTSCITPLTKLRFADILSTTWWIKRSS